jgi:hypothetical protein
VGALVLKERPEICARIGKVVAIWGQVDNEMGNLLGILLGTESEATLEVFLSLRRSSNQRDALASAARFTLKGRDFDTFSAILKVYGSLESQRNALAHGCFGICPDDESLLFWIDIKHHVHFQAEILSRELRGEIADDRHKRLKENMFVYRLADLDTLYDDMEDFWWATFYFNGYLREPTNTGRVAEHEKLREFPSIKAQLREE